MKKFTFTLLIYFCAFFSYSQIYYETNTIEEQVEDFNIFKTTLLECHSGVYDYNDSNSLYSNLKQLEIKIKSSSLTLIEQLYSYKNFITTISRIHTFANHKKLTQKKLKATYNLPFKICYNNELLTILDNYSTKEIELDKNDQLLKINNESIKNITDKLKKLIPTDGNSNGYKNEKLKSQFLYYYFLYNQKDDFLTIEYTHKGDTLISKIKTVNQFKSKKEKREKGINFIVNKNKNYAKLTPPYPLPNNKAYKKELTEIFRELNNDSVRNLILDLRNNGGGATQEYLSGFFIDTAIEYYRGYYHQLNQATYKKYFINKINPQFLISNFAGRYYSNIPSYVEPKKKYNGKLYVLINGNTASAASNLASILKEWSDAIIVGEETGGGYKKYNTGGAILRLPNSKIRIKITTVKGINNTLNEYPANSVTPDININQNKCSDLEEDIQLEYILKHIKSKN